MVGLVSTAKQWGTSIREWGGWILGHPNTAAAARSSYQVVAHSLEQIPAAFAAVGSIVTVPTTRKVAKHVSYIVLTDLIAMVTLTYGVALLMSDNNDSKNPQENNEGYTHTALLMSFYLLPHLLAIQSKLKHQTPKQVAIDTSKTILKDVVIVMALVSGTKLSHYLEEDSSSSEPLDHSWLDTLQYFILYIPTKTLNLSLSILPQILTTRNWVELETHIALTNLEAPALSDVSKLTNICEKEHCKKIDVATGAFYDLATYLATEYALAKIGELPIPLISYMTTVARTHHNGRYIATVALSRFCNEHQIIVLLEYPELAFSLGVGHLISKYLVTKLLETLTGIPTQYYSSAIDKLMLIAHMSIASHMRLPEPPQTRRRMPDPIEIFQTLVALNLQTYILGLDKQSTLLPEGQTPTSRRALHLKSKLPNFNGNKMGLLGKKISASLNPLLFIFLPDFLTDLEKLIHDPVVRDNWPALQKMLINILKAIETAHDSWYVTLASAAPSTTGYAAKGLYGMPPAITQLILQLINDHNVIEKIHRLRTQVEDLQLEKAKPVTPDLKALRRHGEITTKEDYPEQLQRALPASDAVIRPRHPTKEVKKDSIIRISTRIRFNAPEANTEALREALVEDTPSVPYNPVA